MKMPSEFEVQALAYWELKNTFPIVRGEYKIKPDPKARGARFDIVIFDRKENMKLIIEVKKTKYSHSITQSTRYTALTGVPCIYLRGMKDAENAVQIVNKYLMDNGMTID